MRTDNFAFVIRMHKQFRALGLSAIKAMAASKAIFAELSAYGSPEINDDATVRISFDHISSQSVYIDNYDGNGTAFFHTQVPANFQPLMTAKPSEDQLVISEHMTLLATCIQAAEGREHEVLLEMYGERRNEILAINPYVAANIADPAGFKFYQEISKEIYGTAPHGFITYESMQKAVGTLIDIREGRMKEAA